MPDQAMLHTAFFSCGILDVLMASFSLIGNSGFLWLLATLLLLLDKRTRRQGLMLFFRNRACLCDRKRDRKGPCNAPAPLPAIRRYGASHPAAPRFFLSVGPRFVFLCRADSALRHKQESAHPRFGLRAPDRLFPGLCICALPVRRSRGDAARMRLRLCRDGAHPAV